VQLIKNDSSLKRNTETSNISGAKKQIVFELAVYFLNRLNLVQREAGSFEKLTGKQVNRLTNKT
jgi:hypothetical protein